MGEKTRQCLCFSLLVILLLLMSVAVYAYGSVVSVPAKPVERPPVQAISEDAPAQNFVTEDIKETNNYNTAQYKENGIICIQPEQRLGDEDELSVNVIMPPSCVIASDLGNLQYLETYNLTKMLNSLRNQKETIPSILAMYKGSGGRCAAIFTQYESEGGADSALRGMASEDAVLKQAGDYYAYVNDTFHYAIWRKGVYVITASAYHDYTSGKSDKENCAALIEPYLNKIGSDVTPAEVTQVSYTDGNGTGELTIEQAHEEEGSSAGSAPDEDGMAMQCEASDDENGTIICKKVKANGVDFLGGANNEGTPPSGDGNSIDGKTVQEESYTETGIEAARRIAKANSIYLPESDDELEKGLREYSEKNSEDYYKKYGGRELSDKETAEEIRLFSQKMYPEKQPKKAGSASFFGKIVSFVKNIFR